MPIAGGALDETMIPASVQALIAARIDALPPEPKRVLMQASVVGKTFWAGAVAALEEHGSWRPRWASSSGGSFAARCTPPRWKETSSSGSGTRSCATSPTRSSRRPSGHVCMRRPPDGSLIGPQGTLGEDAEIVVHHLDAALELAPSSPELEAAPMQRLLADALLAAGEAAMRTDVSKVVPYLERRLTGSSVEYGDDLTTKLLLARARAATGGAQAARALLEEVLDRSVAVGDLETAIAAASQLDRGLPARRGHLGDRSDDGGAPAPDRLRTESRACGIHCDRDRDT